MLNQICAATSRHYFMQASANCSADARAAAAIVDFGCGGENLMLWRRHCASFQK